MTTTAFGEETFKVKLPSISVITPLVVPFSSTLAPITDSPVASTTSPFTVPACITDCTPAVPAKAGNEAPADNAVTSMAEKKSFLDENFKKSFFIRL